MTTPKRFDVSPPPEDAPLQFVLDGKGWEEIFTVIADIPGGSLSDLSASASVNAAGEVTWNNIVVLRFIRSCLIQVDEQRWDDLLRAKDRLVNLDRLGEIMFWIIGEKAKRPTGPQPSSPDGLRNENSGSEDASSSKDSPETG